MIRQTRAWAALEFRGLNPSVEIDTAITINGRAVAETDSWIGIDGVSFKTVHEVGVFLARNHLTYIHREDVRDLVVDLLCHLASVNSRFVTPELHAQRFVEAFLMAERVSHETGRPARISEVLGVAACSEAFPLGCVDME